MKIEQKNAFNYIQHIKTLGYLSGGHTIEEVKNLAYSTEGEEVYNKLLRIERKANRLAVNYCNGDVNDKTWEKLSERYQKQAEKLLPRAELYGGIIFNGDPRGYTLKMSEAAQKAIRSTGLCSYSDWGGYFIIAPDF